MLSWGFLRAMWRPCRWRRGGTVGSAICVVANAVEASSYFNQRLTDYMDCRASMHQLGPQLEEDMSTLESWGDDAFAREDFGPGFLKIISSCTDYHENLRTGFAGKIDELVRDKLQQYREYLKQNITEFSENGMQTLGEAQKVFAEACVVFPMDTNVNECSAEVAEKLVALQCSKQANTLESAAKAFLGLETAPRLTDALKGEVEALDKALRTFSGGAALGEGMVKTISDTIMSVLALVRSNPTDPLAANLCCSAIVMRDLVHAGKKAGPSVLTIDIDMTSGARAVAVALGEVTMNGKDFEEIFAQPDVVKKGQALQRHCAKLQTLCTEWQQKNGEKTSFVAWAEETLSQAETMYTNIFKRNLDNAQVLLNEKHRAIGDVKLGGKDGEKWTDGLKPAAQWPELVKRAETTLLTMDLAACEGHRVALLEAASPNPSFVEDCLLFCC